MAANTRLSVAAHVVTLLALRGRDPLPSAAIAVSVNTNAVVIRRILGALVRAGIVRCGRGKAGGAALARPAAAVTLRDLAAALGEERLFAVHRNPPDPRCRVSCRMRPVLAAAFADAERAAAARLARVSVAALLGGCHD